MKILEIICENTSQRRKSRRGCFLWACNWNVFYFLIVVCIFPGNIWPAPSFPRLKLNKSCRRSFLRQGWRIWWLDRIWIFAFLYWILNIPGWISIWYQGFVLKNQCLYKEHQQQPNQTFYTFCLVSVQNRETGNLLYQLFLTYSLHLSSSFFWYRDNKSAQYFSKMDQMLMSYLLNQHKNPRPNHQDCIRLANLTTDSLHLVFQKTLVQILSIRTNYLVGKNEIAILMVRILSDLLGI